MTMINIKGLKPSTTNDTKFTPVDADRYTVQVENAEVTKTKAGDDSIAVRMVIVSGELTGTKFAKRKLWARLATTGTAAIYMYRFLEACESPLVDANAVEIGDIASDLVGRHLSVYAEPSTANGQPTTNVSDYKPIMRGDDTPAPLKAESAVSAAEAEPQVTKSAPKSPWE